MKRPGFTLVELVIVIIIIVVLIALLLPATRRAGEAARRSQCSNNLRQIALALQNYHDTFNSLPYGARARGADGVASGFGPSWLVAILPFSECSNQYALLDKVERESTNSYDTEPMQTHVCKNKVPWLLCPSSPLPQLEKTPITLSPFHPFSLSPFPPFTSFPFRF